MNKSKSIYIRSKSGETLYIPLYDKVTVITGESATGKTKMLDWLKACKVAYTSNEIIESSVNLEDIIVVQDREMVDSLIQLNVECKIIFIDRVSLFHSLALAEFIQSSKNLFILLGHRNVTELTSQDAVLGLRHDGKHYNCYQIYENGLFSPTEII